MLSENQFKITVCDNLLTHFETFRYSQRQQQREQLIYEDEQIMEILTFYGGLNYSIVDGQRQEVWKVLLSCSRKIKVIERYWENLAKEINLHMPYFFTISVDPFDYNKGKRFTRFIIPKSDNNEIDTHQAAKQLIQQYHTVYFPILEEESNIQKLNGYYNTPFDKVGMGGNGWFHKLITARLSGNYQYKEIREFIHQHFAKVIENSECDETQKVIYIKWQRALETVHQRLQSVEPLKDPYLGSPKRRQMEEEWRALNR